MATTHQTTIADIERNPPEGNWELVKGEVIAGNPTSLHAAAVVARILTFLNAHVLAANTGLVVGPDAGFVIFPEQNTLLAPDVSFITASRVPSYAEQQHFARLAPDLVVEVMSPSDRMTDALRKISLYLEAGVSLVWLVEPGPRTLSIFQPGQPAVRLAGDQVVTAEGVLLGFSMKVDDLLGPSPAE